ncbi:MAG: crossover junction endodeoxyribonuclease RuvC [Bacillota bacterium]|nr:crossover junction endodeoxyribonuclease RuvC [Bacillota bacterium]
MRVLGIDPGTAALGYGVVEEREGALACAGYGCLHTPAGIPLAERLLRLYRSLQQVVREYVPSAVAVEEIFFCRNQRSAFAVGQARAVALLAAAEAGLPVYEYSPLQVKMAVVGYGRATKTQVQDMVARGLGLESHPRPQDAADALGVAVCCLLNRQTLSRVEEAGMAEEGRAGAGPWGRAEVGEE